jgi:hypothetical protein
VSGDGDGTGTVTIDAQDTNTTYQGGDNITIDGSNNIDFDGLGGFTTDQLSEGSTNLYHTDQRAVDAVNAETSLSVDITGDADSVDGYQGSEIAVLSEDETVTGIYTFNNNIILNNTDHIVGPSESKTYGNTSIDDRDVALEADRNIVFDADKNASRAQAEIVLAVQGTEMGRLNSGEGNTFWKNSGFGGETSPSYAVDAAGQVRGQDGLRVATSNGDYEIQGDGNGNLEILTPSGNRQVLFDGGDIGAFQ